MAALAYGGGCGCGVEFCDPCLAIKAAMAPEPSSESRDVAGEGVAADAGTDIGATEGGRA